MLHIAIAAGLLLGLIVGLAASATGNPVSPDSVALAVIDAMIGELSERRILAARLP